jgi:hypothetical protein
MTVVEYNALSVSRRLDILWEWAFFIGNRREKEQNIVLFSHNNFFIEVRIDLQSNSTVTVRGISSGEIAMLYPEIFSSPAKRPFLEKKSA